MWSFVLIISLHQKATAPLIGKNIKTIKNSYFPATTKTVFPFCRSYPVTELLMLRNLAVFIMFMGKTRDLEFPFSLRQVNFSEQILWFVHTVEWLPCVVIQLLSSSFPPQQNSWEILKHSMLPKVQILPIVLMHNVLLLQKLVLHTHTHKILFKRIEKKFMFKVFINASTRKRYIEQF